MKPKHLEPPAATETFEILAHLTHLATFRISLLPEDVRDQHKQQGQLRPCLRS